MNRWVRWIEGACMALVLIAGALALGEPAARPVPVADSIAVTDTLLGPDAHVLRVWSEAAGVPYVYTWALAFEETQRNPSPGVRGAHLEWGRFQILPSTARARCPAHNTQTYYGNLACFLRMTREDVATCRGDYRCAARIHNGRGPRAYAYADRVMDRVAVIVGREVLR